MAEELPPLGSFAKRALDAESKRADAVDDAMRDRLMSRLSATLALAPVPAPAPAPTPAPALAAKIAPWVAAAFVVGGVVGAGLHAAIAPSVAPLPSSTASVRAPLVPSALPSVVPVIVPLPVVSIDSLPSVPIPAAPSHSAAAVVAPDTDLAAERALVDRARSAIARGQPDAALDAVTTHAKTFPKGRLAEERDALTVQALAQAGRANDARARAARFHVDFPHSVFGAAVDAATP